MYLKKYLHLNINFFSPRVIFIILLWIISFLFVLGFNIHINNIFEEHTMKSTNELTIQNSYNINNYIEHIFSNLSNIGNQLSLDEISNAKETIQNFNSFVLENNLKSLAITDLNGVAYLNNGQIIDVSDRDYFKNALSGKRDISSIVYSKLDGKSSNVFSIPLYKDNKIVAVLWTAILTDNLYKNFNLYTINELGYTFLVNTSGNILVASKNINLQSGSLNLFSKLNTELNNKNLKTIETDFNNLNNGYVKLNSNIKNKYILYYSKLSYEDWWLMSAIPSSTLKTSTSYISKSINIFNIIFMTFTSIIFFIFFYNERKAFFHLKSLAYTDPLTQGKNDTFIKNKLPKLIYTDSKFAFISLEIVNIKFLINVFGFKKGQFLIKEVYEYLLDLLNKDELVVHSYLGEFKLLLKYNDILELTSRLDTISFSKIDENIDFKIGVYLISNHNETFDEMCSYVTIAKESIISSKYMIYTKDIHQREINKIKLENDIKTGIDNKEFKSFLQPKYNKNGEIIGAEALARWYKYGTLISPYIFIPLCESTGLIKDVDELIFEDVCKNLNKWIKSKKKVVPISINLSRNYLNIPNFIDNLEKYIKLYEIPKNLIQFEITESSLIQHEKLLEATVKILHEKGYKVLLDDFGIGYSSIKAISNAKFDTLKIDKSFVDGIGDTKWNNIIKFTINLSNILGMNVVVEGIETEEQYNFLLECNCDIFQGYYFSRPMSPEDFSKLI